MCAPPPAPIYEHTSSSAIMLPISFLVGHVLMLYGSVAVLYYTDVQVYLCYLGIHCLTAHLEFPLYEGAL
jgi:hypothetical protein